tara:strand:- start:197 stop:814 length:618 start_codon:yes stop_codon:yes gene_type:complete
MCKIPKIIHQIWIGPKPIPAHCKKFSQEMMEMHPEWEYHLWGNELFKERYKNDKFLQNYIKDPNLYKWAHISDRLRLLLLRDFGGVYVDVDAKPIRPFDVILEKCSNEHTFFAGIKKYHEDENSDWILDCTVYGSSINSRAVQIALQTYTNINWANGGKMFSDEIIKNTDSDILVLGKDYFYSNEINDKTVILHDVNETRLRSWR